jgi:pimeloyl-ACP methyl ester carboxylesterase
MREHALRLGKELSLVGILTENQTDVTLEKDNLAGVLLFNSGLIHRIGPNRIYVKMARMLAGMGFVVLRFDFSGIGDSGPRRDKLPAMDSVIDEARQVMDYMESSKRVKQFYCVGVCSGASAAARVAAVDHRVKKAVLINPELPETEQIEIMRESSYLHDALLDPRSWVRFFSMRSSYREIWQVVTKKLELMIRPNSFGNDELSEITTQVKDLFRLLQRRRVQLLMLFSESEIVNHDWLRVIGSEYPSTQKSALLTIEMVEGADHLLTPLKYQEKALSMVCGWLDNKA